MVKQELKVRHRSVRHEQMNIGSTPVLRGKEAMEPLMAEHSLTNIHETAD